MSRKLLLKKRVLFIIIIFLIPLPILYAADKDYSDSGKSSYSNSYNSHNLNKTASSNDKYLSLSINTHNYNVIKTNTNPSNNYSTLKNSYTATPAITTPLAPSAKIGSYNNNAYKGPLDISKSSSSVNIGSSNSRNDYKQTTTKQALNYKNQVPQRLNQANFPDKSYLIDKTNIPANIPTKTVPLAASTISPQIDTKRINWKPIVNNSIEDTTGDRDIKSFVQNNITELAVNEDRHLGLEMVPSDLQPQLDKWDDSSKKEIRAHLAYQKSAGSSNPADSIMGLIDTTKKQNILVIETENPKWGNIIKSPPTQGKGFWFPRNKNDLILTKLQNNSVSTQADRENPLPDFSQDPMHTQWLFNRSLIPSSSIAIKDLNAILEAFNEPDPIASINDTLLDKGDKNTWRPVELAGILLNVIRDEGFDEINPDIPYQAISALLRMYKLYPEAREYLNVTWPMQGDNNRLIPFADYATVFNRLSKGFNASPQAIQGAKKVPVIYIAATMNNMNSSNHKDEGEFMKVPPELLNAIRGKYSNATYWGPIEFQLPSARSENEKLGPAWPGNEITILQNRNITAQEVIAAEVSHAFLQNEFGTAAVSNMVHESVDMAGRLLQAESEGRASQVIEGNQLAIRDRARRSEELGIIEPHLTAARALTYLLDDPHHYSPSEIARIVYKTAKENHNLENPDLLGQAFRATAQELYPNKKLSQ